MHNEKRRKKHVNQAVLVKMKKVRKMVLILWKKKWPQIMQVRSSSKRRSELRNYLQWCHRLQNLLSHRGRM